MAEALRNQGPYRENPAFAEFQSISADSFSLFHARLNEGQTSLAYSDLVRRMVYIGETTSVALRLNAIWALTLPAFSLCRDRYEQTVRFSWLARQPAYKGWVGFLVDFELA